MSRWRRNDRNGFVVYRAIALIISVDWFDLNLNVCACHVIQRDIKWVINNARVVTPPKTWVWCGVWWRLAAYTYSSAMAMGNPMLRMHISNSMWCKSSISWGATLFEADDDIRVTCLFQRHFFIHLVITNALVIACTCSARELNSQLSRLHVYIIFLP